MGPKYFILDNECTHQCMKKMIDKIFTIVVRLDEIKLLLLKIQLYVVKSQKNLVIQKKTKFPLRKVKMPKKFSYKEKNRIGQLHAKKNPIMIKIWWL